MPQIKPIRDLRNTSEISKLAHELQEPIFITRNGYSDLVVMSAELYDRIMSVIRVDQAIYDAEKAMRNGEKPMDIEAAFAKLENKYYG